MIKEILKNYSSSEEDLKDLLEYTSSNFSEKREDLGDELFVNFWERQSSEDIKDIILELNFPIEKGISKSSAYKKALEQGKLEVESNFSLDLELEIALTAAGKVPIIEAKNRRDFEYIIQAVSHSNEPTEISPTIGGVMYSGYPNWKRLNEYKDRWKAINSASDLEWYGEYEKIKLNKSLFLDTFIVISSGPYSNVKASSLNISEDNWMDISKKLRKHHEASHYYMKRAFSSAKNNAFDEVLADFVAIVKVFGEYDAEKALLFLGLENYPELNGRLEEYVKGYSDNFIQVIKSLVFDAINNISRIYDGRNPYEALDIFAKFTLPELAAKSSKVKSEFEK